tara:strand:- start:127 stop:531 length:405 start_codon:yes stop_codon:yes gene_type:complete
MKLEKLHQSAAYKSLLALAPSYPEEFVKACEIIREDFGENPLENQTLLCVGRQPANGGEEEEITVITICEEEGEVLIRAHGCITDEETPSYGVNVYQTFGSLVRMQDSVLSKGESWCGQYERELFGRLAEEFRS